MAYNSFYDMQKIYKERLGKDSGPVQPPFVGNNAEDHLKTGALNFIRNRCEDLRFSSESVVDEMNSGNLKGKSLKDGQIPYNMQMDIDRICLEKALEKFIDSGTADDAYTVYFCYLEMFVGTYGSSKAMIELLSEYEMNGSALLLKHRDHYSHSVYVFALGLAIYDHNEKYRNAFCNFYNVYDDKKAAHLYLEYWGLTALFHDIGYPFELPFEQVMSYFEVDNTKRDSGVPFVAYCNLDKFTEFAEDEKEHFKSIYGMDFENSTALFAHDLSNKLGSTYNFSEEYLLMKINSKPVHPEDFNYFMDHAYFSAVRLYRELAENLGVENICSMHVDALTAILLHNSLFKFTISTFKSKSPDKKPPLKMELHPLAFMLMLCDELQCWDRTAYGRTSRSILYPMSADFDLSCNSINAHYHYDSEQDYKIRSYEKAKEEYDLNKTDKKPRLKAYSDMTDKNDFVNEILEIVDLSEVPFTAVPDTVAEDRGKKHIFLSDSSFLHLYDFAVMLSARRSLKNAEMDVDTKPFYDKFDKLSLEYKVMHLDRAKCFSRHLNAIDCFYTDRPVDFNFLSKFSDEQIEVLAPLEHERWLNIHKDAGWIYGTDYEDCEHNFKTDEISERQAIREQLRCHKLMINEEITHSTAIEHFKSLSEEDQDKDVEPMNWMLNFMRVLDGVKIYSLK